MLAGDDQHGRRYAVQVAHTVVPAERAGAVEEVRPEHAPERAVTDIAQGCLHRLGPGLHPAHVPVEQDGHGRLVLRVLGGALGFPPRHHAHRLVAEVLLAADEAGLNFAEVVGDAAGDEALHVVGVGKAILEAQHPAP